LDTHLKTTELFVSTSKHVNPIKKATATIFPDMSASHLPESGADSPNAGTQEIVVFIIRRDSQCGECGRELFKGNFLRLENDKPLCLDCADLGHLEFLPSGDAAVTRRATKYSPLRAVVVQWSHTRKRYERQGILVSPEAIERAEQESLADADQRARQRERAALKREAEDQEYISAVAERLKILFPGCPPREAERIARHACQKHSGRVGRSAAAKEFDPGALRLAVIARIRHTHTRYDELLGRTADRPTARAAVQEQIEKILMRWESPARSGAEVPLI
jgi:hypothetical protein